MNPPKKKKKVLSKYDPKGVIPIHAETVYDVDKDLARFAVYNRESGQVEYKQNLTWPGDSETYHPEDGGASGLLQNGAILLPSKAEEYASEDDLVAEIEGYIRTYMLMPDEFYLTAATYVMLTWISDCFPALPYLRARGDTGSGKSRWLQTIGALCYCPIFASGATTASPIFRIYDAYRRATFLFDEADWDAKNDEFNEVTKILNQGYQKGQGVLRSDKEGDTIIPRFFDVFGPKLLATRNIFADSALESRCFTVGLRMENSLNGIPENIGLKFWKQAEQIRNKLLMWRFKKFHIYDEVPQLEAEEVPHRLRMIMQPMIMTRSDEASRKQLISYMAQLSRDTQDRRAIELEGVVLAALIECMGDQNVMFGGPTQISINDVMHKLNESRESEGEDTVSARKIHNVLKTRLNVNVRRSGKKFVVMEEPSYISKLAKQFGIDEDAYSPGMGWNVDETPQTSANGHGPTTAETNGHVGTGSSGDQSGIIWDGPPEDD